MTSYLATMHQAIHSFPTRRSSDLESDVSASGPNPVLSGTETILLVEDDAMIRDLLSAAIRQYGYAESRSRIIASDRKSTRLNSSHLGISYAVFCLKKKRRNMREYK